MITTARYQAVLEETDRFGRKLRDITLECDPGRKPTIGDFIAAFKREGLEVELSDFPSMTFKPVDPLSTTIISLRVVRTVAVG